MYKKIIAIAAFVLAMNGIAFAAGKIPSGGTFTFKPSTNVDMTYHVDLAGNAQAYTANSKNTAGNRVFSSSNATSNIWYKEDTAWKGKDIANSAEMATPGESTYSGWSSQ